jgi:hypothetical protein
VFLQLNTETAEPQLSEQESPKNGKCCKLPYLKLIDICWYFWMTQNHAFHATMNNGAQETEGILETLMLAVDI